MTTNVLSPDRLARVDDFIHANVDELVETVQSLVRFNTVSVDFSPGSEHTENDEAGLQAFVARRLGALGARVDQWEPDPAELRTHPMMPAWHHWRNRPLTVGVLAGRGGGRSLIINGHIDVVDDGDPDRWTTPAFAADVREGRIYGRGACDMKGGVGAALFALEALRACDISLRGDVIFETVPDEETCAMGTVAAIHRGYRADAGLVPEPTELNLWIATRGLLHGMVTVNGRSAHAEMNQPGWRDGGGVNAISHMRRVLSGLEALSEEWSSRESKRHRLLGVPGVHPTIIRGGVFVSNIPEQCSLVINATYLPADADDAGYGSVPRGEIEGAVRDVRDDEGWLAEHPPGWTWHTDYPPSEISEDSEIIGCVCEAMADLAIDPQLTGIDTTYDGALLTILADTPSPAFGPGDLRRAHAPEEWVGIDELVAGARAYVRAVTAWCGAE
jgi:acetylornithine deacetylase